MKPIRKTFIMIVWDSCSRYNSNAQSSKHRAPSIARAQPAAAEAAALALNGETRLHSWSSVFTLLRQLETPFIKCRRKKFCDLIFSIFIYIDIVIFIYLSISPLECGRECANVLFYVYDCRNAMPWCMMMMMIMVTPKTATTTKEEATLKFIGILCWARQQIRPLRNSSIDGLHLVRSRPNSRNNTDPVASGSDARTHDPHMDTSK